MSAGQRYAPLLRTSRWFSSLPAELQDQMMDAAVLRQLAAGQQLYGRGGPPCGCYCVLEGAVGVTGIGAAGKEMLVAHIDPPKWFGETTLFDDLPRLQAAHAEIPSLLLHVPQPAMESILRGQPAYWHDFGRLVAQKLRLALATIEDMALSPAAVRLPRRLLLLAEGYGDALVANPRLKVHQEQLAMMLSLSRQTANQILQDLAARGVLRLGYGEIEILDFDLLRQAAGCGCG
ncbi:MAG: Crp/Fnr family transcriptional regulator [Nevskia sp.]|nr:Crp/Fnr family transcriptional regulator [Nevskia sp.]